MHQILYLGKQSLNSFSIIIIIIIIYILNVCNIYINIYIYQSICTYLSINNIKKKQCKCKKNFILHWL